MRTSSATTGSRAPDFASVRKAIAENASDLVGEFDVDLLLERILTRAVSLLSCESGSISLVDERAGTYTKKVDLSVGCQAGTTFPIAEGVTGEIVRTRGVVIFDEYAKVTAGHIRREDPRWSSPVIGVPILRSDEIVGACVVFSAEPGHVFTTDDIALMELFADHAGLALGAAEAHRRIAEQELAAAVAEERERAVRDVHAALDTSLAELLAHLDAADDHAIGDPALRSHLDSVRSAVHDARAETWRTALGLGPACLSGNSLADAARGELEWVAPVTGARTKLVVTGDERELPAETAHHAFRILQEALGNTIRHAAPSVVRVGVVYEDGAVTVLVEDDGSGFLIDGGGLTAASLPPGSLGLRGMVSRAHQIGAALTIESTPGWGTKVGLTVPDTPAARDEAGARHWRVLIAAGHPVVRAGIARLLNLSEPTIRVVGEVADAAQLRDQLARLTPDVVVIDLMSLAGMAGADFTGEGRRASLVVVADSPTADEVRAAARAGAVGYVSTSSDPDLIARVVVAAARGESLIDSAHLRQLTGPAATADALTSREREVRALVKRGLPDKQIATALGISVKTVEKHVGSLLRKTGAQNRTMLAGLDLTAS
jgi:DNA-binding NarL/FixJ family response regulator/signal transduction histidine kinase